MEQGLAAQTQQSYARPVAFENRDESVACRGPQDGVEGPIRSGLPVYSRVRFDHRLKVAKAIQVISLIGIAVEVAVREQILDHFERIHLLEPAAKASVRTTRRIEPLGEGVAHEFRVRHQ